MPLRAFGERDKPCLHQVFHLDAGSSRAVDVPGKPPDHRQEALHTVGDIARIGGSYGKGLLIVFHAAISVGWNWDWLAGSAGSASTSGAPITSITSIA